MSLHENGIFCVAGKVDEGGPADLCGLKAGDVSFLKNTLFLCDGCFFSLIFSNYLLLLANSWF
jgi:hypothetical protein